MIDFIEDFVKSGITAKDVAKFMQSKIELEVTPALRTKRLYLAIQGCLCASFCLKAIRLDNGDALFNNEDALKLA